MNSFFPSQVVNYIDIKFPGVKKQREKNASERLYFDGTDESIISFLLKMIDSMPNFIITLVEDESIEYYEAVESIRVAVNTWQRGERAYPLERVPGRGKWNPISLIRKHLSKLSDEGISPVTPNLPFISDQRFQELLRRDKNAANTALNNCEWKAATILDGSVAEAILLDAIKNYGVQNPQKPFEIADELRREGKIRKIPDSIDEWGLGLLVEVALKLDLITGTAADQCRIAKDFRNLVHPGREIRLNQTCDRGTALSAAAAVEHIIRDLSK